jgi:hypothetical protein
MTARQVASARSKAFTCASEVSEVIGKGLNEDHAAHLSNLASLE